MGRGIHYIFSCILAAIVLIFIMKFLGVTTADLRNFLENGIGGGLKFLNQFRGILHW